MSFEERRWQFGWRAFNTQLGSFAFWVPTLNSRRGGVRPSARGFVVRDAGEWRRWRPNTRMKRASEEGEMLRGAGELVEKFRPQGINGIRYDCATQVKDRERGYKNISLVVFITRLVSRLVRVSSYE